ncbi:MAG: UDP-N-acetylmuramoyl-L-alanine--D-glutamate ligase [Peptostreptococcaceae bacterium]|nr:UDP-N-acetylmuramoyl-L-alanine--D-glutamate ligase [Peptostreptococcaceae bacterium]
MDLTNKTVMVIGLGKSGFDLVAFLNQKAKKTIAFDSNASVREHYEHEGLDKVEFHFGSNPTGEEEIDLAVISPGIPLELDFVQRLKSRHVEIIGEVELAYRSTKGVFVGITGTNGKTTTTALVGELFKNAGFDTRVVGNIGKPIISEVSDSNEKTVFVTELSSFQLETIRDFRSHLATIINLTEDHLNRHKTMENYAEIKSRIFENQEPDDFAIVNLDDEYGISLAQRSKGKKFYTSVHEEPKKEFSPALYIKEGKIFYRDQETEQVLIETREIFLKGNHNYENVLIASAMAICYGIELSVITDTLRAFRGVAHRLEWVKDINGIHFVNDSKGTNPDASVKALEAIEKNILLIAGGMDKYSVFDDFIQAFANRVKSAILLGETKNKLAETMIRFGFSEFELVSDMDEAVRTAFAMAKAGDTVLLSPACASWDMYKSFEERGEHFKKIVNELEAENVK